jgi:hypothetical protein
MKKLFVFISLTLLLSACSHGKTQHFRSTADSADAAEVFIIRNNNLFGWGFSLGVIFNDMVIARLRRGEHISFYVEPGFHTVGISKSTLSVPFRSGHKYYFLISADYTQFGFEIDRISSQKGENWIAKTKPLK